MTINNKKLFLIISLVILVALSTAMLFSCNETYDIESIALTNQPSFVTDGIEQGDNLDFSGVALEVKYSNGATELVDILEKCTLSGFDKDRLGTQIITISYENGIIEKSVSLTVNVYRPKDIDSIAVSTTQKVNYTVGEDLDFSGATATVTYKKTNSLGTPYEEVFSLNSTNQVNQKEADYKYDKQKVGTQTLRFNLYGDVYCEYAVEVKDADVDSIALASTTPDKNLYAIGSVLDLTGLKVRIYKTDGTTEILSTVAKREDGTFYIADYPDSKIYALDTDGKEFSSDTKKTAYLYLYFQENSSTEPLKTSSMFAVSVVEKDIKPATLKVTDLEKLVQRDVRGLYLDGAKISVDFNDQTSIKDLSLSVTYSDSSARYEGDGFYIEGYNAEKIGEYDLYIHFLKDDGSEYSPCIIKVTAIREIIQDIVITEKSSLVKADYTRYIDTASQTFSGYVTDKIDLDDYDYTVTYNSGKEVTLTSSDFTVTVGAGLAKSANIISITGDGDSYISLSYTDSLERNFVEEIKTTSSVAVFDIAHDESMVLTPPTRKEYEQNSSASLDLTGAVLDIYYEDQVTHTPVKKITFTGEEIRPYITGFDLTSYGTKTLTVTYLEATRTFDITVLSEVSSVTFIGTPTKTDYIKGGEISKNFQGISAEISYKDPTRPIDTVTDFTDSSWVFLLDGEAYSGYPLSSGYSQNYTVTAEYMGITVDGSFDITVHNYVTDIAFESDTFTTVEGMDLDGTQYFVTATYEDGTSQNISIADKSLVTDYAKSDLTIGDRKVTITIDSAYTGGEVVTTEATLTVKQKSHDKYVLSLKSTETLTVVTKNSPLDISKFNLTEFFDNNTSQNIDYQFVLPTNYDEVTETVSHCYEIQVSVNSTEVQVEYTPTDKNILDFRDGKLLLTVVYDQVNTVTLKQGDSAVSTTVGSTLDLTQSPFTGWTLGVTFQGAPTTVIDIPVTSATFTVTDANFSSVGNTTATISYNQNPSISYKFIVTVTAKVLDSISVDGATLPIIEGCTLSDDNFKNLSLVLTYVDGTTSRLPVGVNSSLIAISGYDVNNRISQDETITLTITYQEKTATVPLTVKMRSLIGIEATTGLSPKDEYFEKEKMSVSEQSLSGVLLTADGKNAKYSLVYDNGDRVDGGEITVSMIENFGLESLTTFNQQELTKETITVLKIVKDSYSMQLTVTLKDRANISVEFDATNKYEYTYGVRPSVAFTSYLDGELNSTLDIKTSYEGTLNTYVYDEALAKYNIVGTTDYVLYLPVGTYTVVLSSDEVLHTATTQGINQFEDRSKKINVSKKALSVRFENTEYSKTYDGTKVETTTLYNSLIFEGFADGEDKTSLSVSYIIKDENDDITDILDAGSFTISLSIDGQKSFLDSYDLTTIGTRYTVEKKVATVTFQNNGSDSHGNTKRVYTTYGTNLTLTSAYYTVDGLIGTDQLDGELLRDQQGIYDIEAENKVEVLDDQVGYYPITLGTLNHKNYQVEGDFTDVYYVIEPKSITVTLGAVTTTYGSDFTLSDGKMAVGSINFNSARLVVGKTLYYIRETRIIEKDSVGTIDLDAQTFTIGTQSYTYTGSTVRYNGSQVANSSVSTKTTEIKLRGVNYYYQDGLIYRIVATVDQSAKSVKFAEKTYYYTEKSAVEYTIQYSGLELLDKTYNNVDITLLLGGGTVSENTSGLGLQMTLDFSGSDTAPENVGIFTLNGIKASLTSQNYYIGEVQSSTYEVTKKNIVVTPDAMSKTYSGDVLTDPEKFGYTLQGLESIDYEQLYQKGIVREQGEDVGIYSYKLGDFTTDNFANYTFTLDTTNSFTVNKKSINLTFTSSEIRKEYDGVLPSLSLSLVGTFYDQDNAVWDKSKIDLTKLTIDFENARVGIGSYKMTLNSTEKNHEITLSQDYSYTITEKKVNVRFEIESGQDTYVPLSDGDQITYDYLVTRKIRAISDDFVAGETIGILTDLTEVSDVKDYVVTAVSFTGSGNYAFRQEFKVSFQVVKKEVFVILTKDALTSTFNSVSSIQNAYTLAKDISGTSLPDTESSYLMKGISLTGQGYSFATEGYEIKVNAPSEYLKNYTLTPWCADQFTSSSFDADGNYIQGNGGMKGSVLIMFVNKKTTSVSIAVSQLRKVYDEIAPTVSNVSVDGNIQNKVKSALTFERLTGPDGTPVGETTYSKSDIGTFRVGIDNKVLDGDAANYYCVLDSDYIYTIELRTVTVSFKQGDATTIYRRYNGLPLTHSDIVSTQSIDYINREILVSGYLPSTTLTSSQIIDLSGVEFVFDNSDAKDVGTYKFGITDTDPNRTFILSGSDDNGKVDFEIRPLQLKISVPSSMYRYYKDTTYYIDDQVIDLATSFTIESKVYKDGVETLLTKDDFPDLKLISTLTANAVAMTYSSSLDFNLRESFTTLYSNFTLPQISEKFVVKPAVINVSVDNTGKNTTVYGQGTQDIEKYLLINGAVNYTLPDGVVYSGNIDKSTYLINIYDTAYYFDNGSVFRIYGSANTALTTFTIGDITYIAKDGSLYKTEGTLQDSTLTVRTNTYTVDATAKTDSTGRTYYTIYLSTRQAGFYYPDTASLRLTGVGTFTVDGTNVLSSTSSGSVYTTEKALYLDGINYSINDTFGYIYRTDGRINTTENTLTIGTNSYIYVGTTVYEIVGEKTDTLAIIDNVPYIVKDGYIYRTGDQKGSVDTSSFTVDSKSYYQDTDGSVYEILGTVRSESDQAFTLNGKEYNKTAGLTYTMDTTAKTIKIGSDSSTYVYGDNMYIRKATNSSSPYTFAKVGTKSGDIITLQEKTYIVDDTSIYLTSGTITSTYIKTADYGYHISKDGHIYMDTEVVVGTMSSDQKTVTFGEQTYYISKGAVYKLTTASGTIDETGREFTIGDTVYVYPDGTQSIAYNLSLVKFEYYDKDGNVVVMTETTPVGEYTFRVVFDGIVENYIDGTRYTGNYIFKSNTCTLTIEKARIDVTLSGSIDWIYRQSAVEGGDFSRDNLDSIMSFALDGNVLDMTGINYPTISSSLQEIFNSIKSTDVVGKSYTIDASSFIDLDTANQNYKFSISGQATINIVKRSLTASVVKIDGDKVMSSIQKEYGTLPETTELGILYTGFSETEFTQSQFEAAVYFGTEWYVIYDYTLGQTNTMSKATAEEITLLNQIITKPSALPKFYVSTYTDNGSAYVELYPVGRNKIAVEDQIESQNYYITSPQSFIFEVTQKPLTLTLNSLKGDSFEVIYSTTLTRNTDYSIAISGIVTEITIDGITYLVDNENTLFYSKKDADFDWLVYSVKVNMNNDGTRIGDPVYLTLGDQSSSKFMDLTDNYSLEFRSSTNIEIKIYNKIDTVKVGGGTLYSAILSDDSYIPIRVFYLDGKESEIIKFYLDGRSTNPTSITVGDGQGNFTYDKTVNGNQIIKITYSETNNGVQGGTDTSSVYITLRKYPTSTTVQEDTTSAQDGYKKFRYYVFSDSYTFTVANIKDYSGTISLDYTGDDASDLYFLFVAIRSNSVVINGVEYTAVVDETNGTLTANNTTYYMQDVDGTTYIYSNRTGTVGQYTYTGRVGSFNMTRKVLVSNGTTFTTHEITTDETDSFEFTNEFSFDTVALSPSDEQYSQIVLSKVETDLTYKAVQLNTVPESITEYVDGAITLFNGYKLLFFTIGASKSRIIYISKDSFATYSLVYVDENSNENNYSIDAVDVFSGLEFVVSGDKITVTSMFKAIDNNYIVAGQGQYSFGTKKTVNDDKTYAYTNISADGEYDRIRLEYSALPVQGKDGVFNFVVFSRKDTLGNLYELSVRMTTSSRLTFYVVESVNGKESVSSYSAYKDATSIGYATYVDFFDGNVHYFDVYLNRLSGVMTVIVDDKIKASHSLLKDEGITLSDGSTLSDIRFLLEDYTEWQDGDQIFTTTRVDSTVYFTVKNLSFTVSAISLEKLGFSNEMTAILIPSGEGQGTEYVTEETPLVWIDIAKYFVAVANYTDGTTIKYFINGVEVENYALHLWLQEGLYTLSAKLYYQDLVIAESYYDLYVKKEIEKEKLDGTDISPSMPYTITDTALHDGKTAKHYNFFKSTFTLTNKATYSGDTANLLVNIKTSEKGSTALDTVKVGYYALTLVATFGDVIDTTTLVLSSNGRSYTLSTDQIDWKKVGEYTIISYMDDYNHIITVSIYSGDTLLYTFTMQKDSLSYSTTGFDIDNERNIEGYTEKSGDILDFIESVGVVGIRVKDTEISISSLETFTDLNVRENIYSVTGVNTTGTISTTTDTAFNSRIKPTTIATTLGQYQAVMIGDGNSRPYATEYNSYVSAFSLTRSTGTATARFIIAENLSTDVETMYTSYMKDNNFTSTRGIALVYTDNGITAELAFYFMTADSTRVYKQSVYRTTDRTDSRILSDGKIHTITANIFRTKETLSGTLTSADVTVLHIQVAIDGQLIKSAVTGETENYYFPYYNSLAYWKDTNGQEITSSTVDICDKLFLNRHTMAGVIFENCTANLYQISVALCDTLEVSDEFITTEVKGGTEDATNYYYFSYFSDLVGLGGAVRKERFEDQI